MAVQYSYHTTGGVCKIVYITVLSSGENFQFIIIQVNCQKTDQKSGSAQGGGASHNVPLKIRHCRLSIDKVVSCAGRCRWWWWWQSVWTDQSFTMSQDWWPAMFCSPSHSTIRFFTQLLKLHNFCLLLSFCLSLPACLHAHWLYNRVFPPLLLLFIFNSSVNASCNIYGNTVNLSVCLSVCLSLTRWYCVKVEILSPSDNPSL